MNDELYLILHKVRGEPAFDIAQKIMIGEKEGWIIPTSGHRAYPLSALPVSDPRVINVNGDDWKSLPDHYEPKRDDHSHLIDAAREILMRKGLISAAKPANTYRRI